MVPTRFGEDGCLAWPALTSALPCPQRELNLPLPQLIGHSSALPGLEPGKQDLGQIILRSLH